MLRVSLFGWLVIAGSPAAAAERAAIAVSLRVEPSCAARLPAARHPAEEPAIVCTDMSMKRSIEHQTPPPYTLRTYRDGDRTVISVDF